MKNRHPFHFQLTIPTNLIAGIALCFLIFLLTPLFASDIIPTDIKMPGTQPLNETADVPPVLLTSGHCGCHSGIRDNTDPSYDPLYGWEGAMMANAGRDPLFWATVAVAEQDFLPNSDPALRGGVGDLCIRCHSTAGWTDGRSHPTDASALDPTQDAEGVMCHHCHLMTNPDQANTIPNPAEGVYIEEQHAPFQAHDSSTGEGYYGGTEYVLNSGETRLGPYGATSTAKHDVIQSSYHRDARLCGTCHDVSNPAVGDLAHNHGSIAPFSGSFSGVPGGPVEEKAALNNAPHTYGIVERTFSEWIASGIDTLLVNDYNTLPADLKVPGGSLDIAYHKAYDARSDANYEDGTLRYFTCQTCHMAAANGWGAKQGLQRTDLPHHDQTGGSYWIQDAIIYQDNEGTLLFGTGLSADQITEMGAAQLRAEGHVKSAASLSAQQVDNNLEVRATNLTGHKLISGYPEGRRMWLNIKWYDSGDALIAENGAYGPIGNQIQDLTGTVHDVESILDFSSTRIIEAKPAMTKEWADQLIALGYDTGMPLEWDRDTNLLHLTLGDLAAEAAGSMYHTFHFVLNNAMYSDNRIPPYGFSYDTAFERNAIPVPADQFGDPGSGGTYNYWDTSSFPIPPNTDHAEVRLFYQSTSWEYIQFLWLQNDTLGPFLGTEGINLLDAWLNTGMAPPLEMTLTSVSGITPPATGLPGEAAKSQHLHLEKIAADLSFTWGAPGGTCQPEGYGIFTGDISGLSTGYQHDIQLICDRTPTSFSLSISDPQVTLYSGHYFLVTASTTASEGSYGRNSASIERPPSGDPCYATQDLTACN